MLDIRISRGYLHISKPLSSTRSSVYSSHIYYLPSKFCVFGVTGAKQEPYLDRGELWNGLVHRIVFFCVSVVFVGGGNVWRCGGGTYRDVAVVLVASLVYFVVVVAVHTPPSGRGSCWLRQPRLCVIKVRTYVRETGMDVLLSPQSCGDLLSV